MGPWSVSEGQSEASWLKCGRASAEYLEIGTRERVRQPTGWRIAAADSGAGGWARWRCVRPGIGPPAPPASVLPPRPVDTSPTSPLQHNQKHRNWNHDFVNKPTDTRSNIITSLSPAYKSKYGIITDERWLTITARIMQLLHVRCVMLIADGFQRMVQRLCITTILITIHFISLWRWWASAQVYLLSAILEEGVGILQHC